MLASPGGPDRFDITGEAARERVGVEVAVTGGSEGVMGSIRRRRARSAVGGGPQFFGGQRSFRV